MSEKCQHGTSGRLFDDLVSGEEEVRRHVQAERLSGLAINDRFEFTDCMTGRSPAFSPLRIRPV